MSRFVEGEFQELSITFPQRGMNTTVTPQALPLSFARYLENIIPSKAGTGSVRNGTVYLCADQDMADDSEIIEYFNFVNTDGTEQHLVYAYDYVTDITTARTWINKSSISFDNGGVTSRYVVGLPIRIQYLSGGTRPRNIYPKVVSVGVVGTVVTLVFEDDELPVISVPIQSIAYASGKIKLLNESTGAYTDVRTNVTVQCIPRATQFQGKLIVVNGVDPVIQWDGTSFTVVTDEVEDPGTSKTWSAQNQFSINVPASEGTSNYPAGSTVAFLITGSSLAVTSITRSGTTATVVTSNAHNLQTGTVVTISGAVESQYNITATITTLSPNSFTYEVSGSPATPATGTITYGFVSQRVTGTVQSTTFNGVTLTVTMTGAVFPNSSITINKVFYQGNLPAFSFIYKAHDRLWALGQGIPKALQFRTQNEAMRVYYAQLPNSVTGWYNQSTRSVPSIDLRGKHPVEDNLEGMAQINDGMAFFGRDATQLWGGTDPTIPATDTNPNKFIWNSNVSVGALHGNLIQELPNDVAFISKYGLQTLSRVNISQQFATSDDLGSAVDASVEAQIDGIFVSDEAYRYPRSFKYPSGRFIGFQLSKKPMIFSISNLARGWVFFSGDFREASSFGVSASDKLILALGNKLYRYADGNKTDGTLNWADDNGVGVISWAWITPWIRAGKARWGNNRGELLVEPNKNVTINVSVSIDNDIGNQTIFPFNTDFNASFWGQAQWAVDVWGGRFENPIERLRFVASTFAIAISGETRDPVELFELRLYGRAEHR